MKFYIGVTDSNWFNYLSSIKPDEVNFWKPSGGYFFKNVSLPISLAWKAFGEKMEQVLLKSFQS